MRASGYDRLYKPVEFDGRVYRCASDAAVIARCCASDVVACCKGRRKDVRGMTFRYVRRSAMGS